MTFGMSTLDVERRLGPPSGSSLDIHEDPLIFDEVKLCFNRKWEYHDLGLWLSFSAKDESSFDLRLSSLVGEHPDTTIWGTRFIGLTEQEFKEVSAGFPTDDLELKSDFRELESDDPDLDVWEFFSQSFQLSFWIEQGIVANAALWPDWNKNEFPQV